MTGHVATDIDALALLVRDPNSKRLIDDAISAYRGGALRSAVVSTWNAVANDIISKAQELHSLDEKRANAFIKKVDNAVQSNDIAQKLIIERNLLDDAASELQLITHHEHDMLTRIRKDRHICAHPSLVREDQLFEPTPDLVKSHIVNALDVLLIHAPLQGRAALNRLKEDINSESFPSTQDGVRRFIYSKYLKSSKDVLIESLTNVIYKVLVKDTEPEIVEKRKREFAWILIEISSNYGDIFERVSKSFLGQPSNFKNDRSILNICSTLGIDRRIWSWIDIGVQSQIKELIEKSSIDEMEEYFILDALNINDISSSICVALDKMKYRDQIKLISSLPHKDFVKIGIEMYVDSNTFDHASNVGKNVIVPLSKHFNANDIKLLLAAVKENSQIYACWDTESVLEKVFEKTEKFLPDTKDEWRSLLDHKDEPRFPNIHSKAGTIGKQKT